MYNQAVQITNAYHYCTLSQRQFLFIHIQMNILMYYHYFSRRLLCHIQQKMEQCEQLETVEAFQQTLSRFSVFIFPSEIIKSSIDDLPVNPTLVTPLHSKA